MSWPYQSKDVTRLQLEISSFCNLACPGCERTFNKDETSILKIRDSVTNEYGLSKKDWKITEDNNVSKHLDTTYMELDKIKEWFTRESFPNLRSVCFSGAIDEPTTHPDIIEICKYFKNELNVSTVSINSNGSLKTPSFWKKLGELKIVVEFALDGLKDTLPIYRIGSNYNKVIENAKAFIEAGGFAIWKMIDFVHNTHQVEQARLIAKHLKFKEFILVKSSRPSSKHINTPHEFNETDSGRVECKAAKDPWLFVNYDGVMSPCCYFGYNERSQNPEDNIHNTSPKDYFNNSAWLKDVANSWESDKPTRRCDIKCRWNRKDIVIRERV